jgi:hypothetical protein
VPNAATNAAASSGGLGKAGPVGPFDHNVPREADGAFQDDGVYTRPGKAHILGVVWEERVQPAPLIERPEETNEHHR